MEKSKHDVKQVLTPEFLKQFKDSGELNTFMEQPVYTAADKDLAWNALEELEKEWGQKYPHAIRSWKNNWEDLAHFFDFPLEIRTLIYTTNIIENLNGKIRKYTKTKMSFPDDQAVMKAVFLSLRENTRKWTLPIRNWSLVVNQFINIFEKRCRI